jgi:hypothetical protein
MTALQPTLIAYSPEGSRQQFTPPPQHILPAAAVEAVQVGLPLMRTIHHWLCVVCLPQLLIRACLTEHSSCAFFLLLLGSFHRSNGC